jgi:hypothetical protein
LRSMIAGLSIGMTGLLPKAEITCQFALSAGDLPRHLCQKFLKRAGDNSA